MAHSHSIGELGETLAADYLSAQGYTVLATHARSSLKEMGRARSREVDLVCRDERGEGKGMLVFVEVKTRISTQFGEPVEAVDRHKLARLISVAHALRAEHRWTGPWRIDVVAIRLSMEGGLLDLNHVKDVTL